MNLQNIYFAIKPFLPWSVRIFLRRRRAGSRKRSFHSVWPIDPAAGKIPKNWPGWPDNKRFAVVLTHDVEGAKGLSRTLQLMEIERKHGFRSSFNFVPEGDYRVNDRLRHELDRAGFEVGVHGLEHDGKLYKSKSEFARKAKHIRAYMRKWNASGFRSPFMQNKLGWLHQLGVEYDASTFDTDPFEPQPHGVGTIFPFWVPAASDGGYVELPYTLVQDFTLFTILGQTNTDLWKAKVDWIASRGGMVLLNTHPDYICFEGAQQRDEYPVSYYEDFLAHLNSTFHNQFWSALPREVARFYRATSAAGKLRSTRRKVCIVADGEYGADDRLPEYAKALVDSGDSVEVIILEAENVSVRPKLVSGAVVTRLRCGKSGNRYVWTNALRLLWCLFALSARLTLANCRMQYDLIHFCNVSQCLVFSAWYAKLTGTKLILTVPDTAKPQAANALQSKPGNLYARFRQTIEGATSHYIDRIIASKRFSQAIPVSFSLPRGGSSTYRGRTDVGAIMVAPQIAAHSSRSRGAVRSIVTEGDDQTMTDPFSDQDRHDENRNSLRTRDSQSTIEAWEVGRDDYLDIVASLLVEKF